MSHRKAPLPASMRRTPYVWGTCRWCDQSIVGPDGRALRLLWHPACVTAYKLIHWPAETRKAVRQRDHGICARCGCDSERQYRRWSHARNRVELTYWQRRVAPRWHDRILLAARCRLARMGKGWKGGAWQHDHIRPLVEARGDITYWLLDNIQTLCGHCHVEKGREDHQRRKQQRAAPVERMLL